MPNTTRTNRRPGRYNKDADPSSGRVDRSRSQAGRRAPGADAGADPKRNYERYLSLARAAAQTGDTVEIENLKQHAEHYFRLMREQTA